jgi:hypothetical protein
VGVSRKRISREREIIRRGREGMERGRKSLRGRRGRGRVVVRRYRAKIAVSLTAVGTFITAGCFV